MATTLQLKKRLANDQVGINRRLLVQKIEQDKQQPGIMASFFEQALASNDLPDYVHDKQHLELIAYWQPEGGLTTREDAKWLGLRARISRLDDTAEGGFTLNSAQADLIWKRLKDERFKGGRGEQWSAFMLDYLSATRNVFEDVGAELLDTADPKE
jgi:hypothetical protein